MRVKLNAIPKTALTILKETAAHVQTAQILMVASSLAYTTILSIIPFLAVSFAIFQAFGGMEKLYQVIEPLILSNLAQGTSKEVTSLLHQFIDNTHAAAVGVTGMIGLIVTSITLLASAEKGINQAWGAPLQKRGFIQRFAIYWMLITLGPLALSVAVGVATSSQFPLERLFPSGTGMYLISVGIFYCIYQWVPHVRVKWVHAFLAAVIAATCWNFARVGYGIYTEHFVSYATLYGSLGAVPILLLWIYIVWVIVLTGAALTATLQKLDGSPSLS